MTAYEHHPHRGTRCGGGASGWKKHITKGEMDESRLQDNSESPWRVLSAEFPRFNASRTTPRFHASQ